MRVLVLRPQPAASRTAGKLTGRGHEPALLPLSQALHDGEAVKTALETGHSALAITSAEAARMLAALGGTLSRHRETPLYAVGRASGEAAEQAGFRNVRIAGSDGAALADLIIAREGDRASPSRPLLYLAGTPRAPAFELRLTDAGLPHRTIECYRMAPLVPAPDELERALGTPPDAVLLHSSQSARLFFALLPLERTPGHFAAMRILCMSANIAASVPETFRQAVAISPAPDEESLLGLLG